LFRVFFLKKKKSQEIAAQSQFRPLRTRQIRKDVLEHLADFC